MTERWLAVAGYEGLYEVSDLGRVRSLTRTTTSVLGRQRQFTGKILTPSLEGSGYPIVGLYRNGHHRSVKVSRLVARAFVAGEGPGLEVCHNDSVRTNSAATNLRWDTHVGNMADMVARITHCRQGHEFTPENTRMNDRQRLCITCRRGYSRRDREKAKAHGRAPNAGTTKKRI